MKKSLIALFALVFLGLGVYAQSPSKFNYQAIARDADGLLLENTNVGIRISVLQGSSSGSEVYSEEHSPTTNDFGLFNLQVGTGSNVSGDLSTIDWGADSYFIQVEFDEDGGSNYTVMSSSELVSVPYSLLASDVVNDSVIDDDSDPMNEIQTISLVGDSLMLSSGGSVDLSMYDQSDHVMNDMDVDSTNELITDVVWDGDSNLTITEAGADWDVDLSSLIDDDDWVRANDSTIYNNDDWVGVGTDDPAAALNVKGGAIVTDGDASGSVIVGDVDSAHLAIDGNEVMAKYGADSADRLFLQRRGKLSVGTWYHNSYKAIFATDSNDYQGGYGGIFNYRHYAQGNHGWATFYNLNNRSSGGANTFGLINVNQYSDSTDFGTYNFNYANGYGNSYGTYNELLNSADSAIGTYNLVTNPSTNSFGVYNKLQSSNYYNHYGSYTEIDSTYYAYGSRTEMNNGTYNYGSYSDIRNAYYGYGDYNYIYYPYYGYGEYNYIYYPTYYGYGTYNNLTASNGYSQYGVYNRVYQYSTGQSMGIYNYARGNGYVYGLDNSAYNYGTYGNVYAVDNYAYASGSASSYTTYGTYNRTYNYRTGYYKYNYGTYNYTYSASGGTYVYNYGLYNYSYTGAGTYRYNYGLYSYAGGGTSLNYAGYFSGSVYASSGYYSSDRNIKKNIADYEGALDDVMQLRARTYEFDLENNPTMGLPEEAQIGVIAQELEEVFPELVKTTINPKVRMGEAAARDQGLEFTVLEEAKYDEEGNLLKEAQVEAGEELEFKAVNYNGLIPVLIKATQEQQEIIESQNATIEALIERIEALENN